MEHVEPTPENLVANTDNPYGFSNFETAAYKQGLIDAKRDVREYMITLMFEFNARADQAEEQNHENAMFANIARARLASDLRTEIFNLPKNYTHVSGAKRIKA